MTSLILATGAHAVVSPTVASRDGLLYVSVTGLPAASVEVNVGGGVASGGKWFGWVPLRQTGAGSWRTVLRAPGFFGVYPLQVRAGERLDDAGPLVRILPPGFERQPGFFTPPEVAAWWARTAAGPGAARLLAARTWQRGFYTHRDPRFNRLLRVSVAPSRSGEPQVRYLSIARLRIDGPWRFLEAVAAP